MKMSDVFNLPLEVRNDLIFFSKSDTCYAKIESVSSRKEEVEVSSAIHKAINNHDRLEQENAELKSVLTKVLSQAEHRAAARHIFERDEFEWAVNRLNKLNKE